VVTPLLKRRCNRRNAVTLVGDEEPDGLRLQIEVGSCSAFVAALRNHAEIAFTRVNRAVADGRIPRLGCQTPRSRVWRVAERLFWSLESSDESWGHSASSASVQFGESL
jgi:hypothetical protein